MAEEFKEFIDKVRNAADIVEVVESYNVSLKKAGVNLKGLCPFHSEKTPSFIVSPPRQSFHCFGCGVGGDAITFVQKIDNVTFREAIEALAGRYHIPVPQFRGAPISPEQTKRREAQYQVMELAAKFFAKRLFDPKFGRDAIAYLQKRGTTKETVQKFVLGISSDNWTGLMDEAKRAGYSEETLLSVGLIQERSRGGGMRDRFFNRLMFPIWDPQGRVVAFGGRAMTPEDEPKYLNSPETELYKKHQILYGFHFAKSEISKRDEAIIVEGYFDATALHQFGFTNAVATCGTALTDDQARLLRRLCDSVIFLYDADAAGQKAMARGCEVLMGHDFTIRVATLTEGEDPDSFLQKNGAQVFEEYLRAHARDFFTFLVDFLLAQHDDGTIRGRSRAIDALAPMIAKAPKVIVRNDYARRAAQMLGLNESDVFNQLAQLTAAKPSQKAPSLDRAQPGAGPHAGGGRQPSDRQGNDSDELLERAILRFALLSPVARRMTSALYRPEYFLNDTIRALVERVIESGDADLSRASAALELGSTDEERALLSRIVVAGPDLEAGHAVDKLDPEKTARDLMTRLHRRHLKHFATSRTADLATAQESGNEEEVKTLRDEVHNHHTHRIQLANEEYKTLPRWGE